MLEAIVASVGYAGGVVADKIILCRNRVPVMRFIPLLFIWISIITAILLPIFGQVKWEQLLTTKYIILFILMIAIAVTWNIFYYRGIQKEEIHEFELIMLLSPLATILFAEIFLPAERDWTVFIAAVIASGALLATRFRHHHLKIGKTAWQTMLAMVLMSAESIFIKEMLAVLSPVTLYFVRTIIIGLFFVIVYRPKLFSMSRNSYALTIISAMFGVLQMVLKFYGFDSLGVIETTMILVMGPFLVYFVSTYYFKEKLFKRDVFAAIVVVLSILFVTFKDKFL